MEECLRIDCVESAVSFVLCFNFDKRNSREKTMAEESFSNQSHLPLISIWNRFVDKITPAQMQRIAQS